MMRARSATGHCCASGPSRADRAVPVHNRCGTGDTTAPLPKTLSSGTTWVLCLPLGFWCHRHLIFATHTAPAGAVARCSGAEAGIGIAATVSSTGAFRHDLFMHLLASGLAAVAGFLINHWIVFPHPSAN